MPPKRHHYIPRLHLKRFIGTNPKGQVWTYDAHTGNVRSSTPENTAVESHFYSAENSDGTMDIRIEEYLASIEGKSASVYEGLLRGEIPKNSQERADFSVFLALMYVRTPAMRRMCAEIHGRGLQILNYAYGSNEKAFETVVRRFERERGSVLDAETKETVRQNLLDPSAYVFQVPKERTFSILNAADKLSPLFFNMKWPIALPAHGFFITSDNPLVRQVDQRTYHPIYGDHGFYNKTVEVTFPLSPQYLLIMSWNKNAPDIGVIERSHVDLVNEARSANSDRYLYAHIEHKRLRKLAADFKDSRPAMTTVGFGPDKFAQIEVPRRSKR